MAGLPQAYIGLVLIGASLLFRLVVVTIIGSHPLDSPDYLEEDNNHQMINEVFVKDKGGKWTIRREPPSAKGRNDTPSATCLWPECDSDRIVEQLMLEEQIDRFISILPPDKLASTGQQVFLEENCPVNKCKITYDSDEADLLIFQNSDLLNETIALNRRKDQIWVAYLLESPVHTYDRRFSRKYRGNQVFNWTASYRSDSDIVTPYFKFLPFSDQLGNYEKLKSYSHNRAANQSYLREVYANTATSEVKHLIGGKSGKVAWFSSNCHAANNRLEYARELAKHIQVDIYGSCGQFTCSKWNNSCLDMVNKSYKFYLAFENSNCRQYITEKLYKNALGYNDLNHLMLPIVMGASRSEYEEFAPPASFIHVDDFKTPEKLANYLKELDKDDSLYYSYFHWKTVGKFIDTKFMCRICAMAHHSYKHKKHKFYSNIKDWWNNYSRSHLETTVSACD